MSRLFTCSLQLLAGIVAASWLGVAVHAQTLLFSDDLSTGTGWEFSHFGGTAKPSPNDISEADFGFNYAALGIPEAPNSQPGNSTRRGLRLATNTVGEFAGDQIAVVYESPLFVGQYTVQVDAWLNWAPNVSDVGTTEHIGVLAGFNVADAQRTFSPGQNGAGVLYSSDGGGGCSSTGSACDYMLVKNGSELDLTSGQYGQTSFGLSNQAGYDNTDSNANLNLQTLFPSFNIATATSGSNATGTQPAGALGFQWVTVTLEVDADAIGNGTNGHLGTVKVTLESHRSGNSFVLGIIDNSIEQNPADGINTYERPVNLEGGIGLMMTDLFASGPTNPNFAFALFDNVRVYQGLRSESLTNNYRAVPEPASFMLLATLAVGLCVGRWQRS
jgi:hypothetical protein